MCTRILYLLQFGFIAEISLPVSFVFIYKVNRVLSEAVAHNDVHIKIKV